MRTSILRTGPTHGLWRRFLQLLCIVGMVGGALFVSQSATAQSGGPIFVAGNPACGDLGYNANTSYKIDPPNPGTYYLPGGVNTITITTTDGIYFDWTSTLPIDAVIVKGGPNANVYVYDPEAMGGTGLHAPINPGNNMPYGLSHIEFCYDYELNVTKTAATTYTRTYEWDITKSVTPATWDLFAGEAGTSEYTVSVTKTGYTDSDWAVSGTITIANNSPFAATIVSVSDVISGYGAVTPSCGVTFPYVLPAGETLNCTYSASLLDGDDRTNTATVTTSGDVGGGTATAAVNFAGATVTEVNATINVDDTYDNKTWSTSDTYSWTYLRYFTCFNEGENHNTATIRETGQSDNATVTVDCHTVDIAKTVNTALTRTYNWMIDKSVTPDTWNLFTGDSGTSEYTVSVTKTGFTDSDWFVSGTITLTNNHPTRDVEITSLTDVINGTAATVSCPDGGIVPADGGTLVCTYEADLGSGATQTNTATAKQRLYSFDEDEIAYPIGTIDLVATEEVNFAGASVTEVNPSINVDDTNGDSWLFSGTGSVNYTKTFTCDSDEGDHANRATILETGQYDDASVTVNCYAPVVSKTAEAKYDRTWFWTIDKSADKQSLILSTGQQFLVNYTVTVGVDSYIDVNASVSGTITVENPHPTASMTVNVSDVVNGRSAKLDCYGVLTIPPGETGTCGYFIEDIPLTAGTNTATVTLNGINFYATADYAFEAPTYNFDYCVNVSDDKYGDLGTVCANEAPYTFTYSMYVGPYDVCGDYSFVNTATYITPDQWIEMGDSWTITVNVPCDGCTLTPGYWKTHSSYGPAPYDDTWALLPNGADTPFFLSGQTYYNVLWTAPSGGNPYYTLAHAYIAALLNFLNGADPSAAQTYFDQATVYLTTYTPAQMGAWKTKDKPKRDAVIALAYELDRYNNGLIGPGHCTEETDTYTTLTMPFGNDQQEVAQLKDELRLEQNTPNPFNGFTTFAFTLPEPTKVRLNVYSMNGQFVATVVDNFMDAGAYRIEWNVPEHMSAGIYVYRLQTEGTVLTKKMTFLR